MTFDVQVTLNPTGFHLDIQNINGPVNGPLIARPILMAAFGYRYDHVYDSLTIFFFLTGAVSLGHE